MRKGLLTQGTHISRACESYACTKLRPKNGELICTYIKFGSVGLNISIKVSKDKTIQHIQNISEIGQK